MTLLLAVWSSGAMVLAADGFCHKTEVGERWVDEDLQKTFPLPGRPVAIAHHGQNILQGCDIGRVVRDFAKTHECNLGNMTIEDMASTLKCDVDPSAQREVVAQHGKEAIGFWVAGFGAGQDTPELYEVFWMRCGQQPTKKKLSPEKWGQWAGEGWTPVREDDDAGEDWDAGRC